MCAEPPSEPASHPPDSGTAKPCSAQSPDCCRTGAQMVQSATCRPDPRKLRPTKGLPRRGRTSMSGSCRKPLLYQSANIAGDHAALLASCGAVWQPNAAYLLLEHTVYTDCGGDPPVRSRRPRRLAAVCM